MKILVLNGSPKGEKSNTLQLTSAFCEGIVSVIPSEIEILPVNKMNIKDCLGCFACWSKTPGICCIKDDMPSVIEKILNADILIWSFPLYYYSLPSRLKALMDRQLPMVLPFMENNTESGGHPQRYDMSGKRYVAISTCGFYTAQGNYTAVDTQLEKLYGKGGYTSIYCGQGELFRVPSLRKRTEEYLSYVYQAGREFASGSINAATREHLSELLYPREVFEQMADADWGIQAADKSGNQTSPDISLNFTKQMAALYNHASWNGKDKVLEFYYTDVDKTFQIVMKKDGHEVLTGDFLPYTTRIETPLTVWQKIGSGELDGQKAMMERLYTVQGDFDLMIHWDDYFGFQESSKPQTVGVGMEKAPKKTNMNLLLLPWITIWVLLSIDGKIGGITGILLSAALPLTFLKWKPTVFEYLTIPAVTGISLLSVLGASAKVILPLSYLLFGVMWSVTVFLKIPLTAYYSMNAYNGEAAWKNPLFIRTNRILTACWGVLYLLTPIWTYFLLNTSAASFTGAINSVLPALLGIFTGWFQNWYPKHYASGK